MGQRREILERLTALERGTRSHGNGHGHECCGQGDRGGDGHHHHRDHHHGGGGDFDEKRVIDTIVHLVSERVGRLVEDQQGRSQSQNDGGSEKRIVDLIVGLVSEHVREIVSTELDRRFGRSDAACAEVPPPSPSPPSPPAGSPKREQS